MFRRFWTIVAVATSLLPTAPDVMHANPLDGRAFNTDIVQTEPENDEKKGPLNDQLTFSDGQFSSALCRRHNFSQGPYWVRVEGDRTHFLAELTSPTSGTMIWKGTVRGDTLEGTMRWRKKRWYWTINVEHKIRGKANKAPIAAPPQQAEKPDRP